MLGHPQNRKPESDSENDSDYASPHGADEESPSSEDEQPESKRVRAEISERSAEEGELRKKALWESFQASVTESSSAKAESAANKKMIKVCKQYHFAGENVTEVVEVPEDSPDAKKWPVWQSLDETEVSAPTSEEPVPPPSSENHPNSPPPTEKPSKPPAPAPAGKRPGPRKSKTRLPELPGRSSTMVKKLTTLDKSVMDWKAHVQSSENEVLHDELEANRRGGGYLEKVEFLQRVDERKDVILDAANTSKRKRS